MNRLLLTLVGAAALVSSVPVLVAADTTQPAATQAATQPGGEPIAVVNGMAIDRERFMQALMSMGGARLFEQWLSTMVAEQDCLKQGIQITDDMVKAEKDRVLDGLAAQGVPAANREQALMEVMAKRNISSFEMGLTLRRAAALRALSKGRVEATDDQVQQAFDAAYGDRVVINDMIFPDRGSAAEVKVEADKKGLPITDVASLHGVQQQQIQISANAQGLPPTIMTVAFQLKEGETSSIIDVATKDHGTSYHLLYCVKKLPADKTVQFADVKAKVKASVQEQLKRAWSEQYLNILMSQARIDVKDPVLSIYYGEMIRRINAQRAASTQPAATAPAK